MVKILDGTPGGMAFLAQLLQRQGVPARITVREGIGTLWVPITSMELAEDLVLLSQPEVAEEVA